MDIDGPKRREPCRDGNDPSSVTSSTEGLGPNRLAAKANVTGSNLLNALGDNKKPSAVLSKTDNDDSKHVAPKIKKLEPG